MALEKNFIPKEWEEKIYYSWEAQECFETDMSSSKPSYCIMMPPPNVTGNLHLGHALTYTLQDVLIRFKRMLGYSVLWQPGTDHAGIATQMVVERQLAEQKLSRNDLGRENFLKKVWQWKQHSGDTIVHQQKRLGISPDWNRQRFTMDEGLSKTVVKVFCDLYNEKLIYRDKRLVNWDIAFQTAVSDLEVTVKETDGRMYYIHYPLEHNPHEFITIATTRPETMFGDVAVAVHPEDIRYQHLIGKKLKQPITGHLLDIIADDYCDIEKGTGAVKITPAHDFNDFAVGQRHHLEMPSILNKDGTLNNTVPEPYQGLDIPTARKNVLEELENLGVLEKSEPIKHQVPYGERSGIEIQPILTDQWFVNAKVLAEEALKAIRDGRSKFVPKHWENTYYEWLENIQPWCISRQIWWGHQIPAWYGPDQTIFVANSIEDANLQATQHYGHSVTLIRDEDVLDTWFSSALWPFTTLGWPEKTDELEKFYPTSVLVTGFDIIFFWVARMMMMGLHFMGKVPFQDIYIHALVRDEKGAKMSKSKGNIIDPLAILDTFGCDALRFTLTSLAVPGRDIRLSEPRIEGNRNFMTKIWNAARFLEHYECHLKGDFSPQTVGISINQWIVSQVNDLASQVKESLERYRFDEAGQKIYQFIWGIYCDYYLEFIKPFLTEGSQDEKEETQQCALWVFDRLLKILHPIAPFITESLYQSLGLGKTHLMMESWPETLNLDFEKSKHDVNLLITLIDNIRSLRSMYHIPPSEGLDISLILSDRIYETLFQDNEKIISRLGRIKSINFIKTHPTDKGYASFIVERITAYVNLKDSIDLPKEINRMEKELSDVIKEIEKTHLRLNNPDFLQKAKPEVIEEMQERLTDLDDKKDRLQDAISRLK